MKLTRLDISNFRGIETATIYFGQHTVIIGHNNSGKSTIIDAIALLLGREKLAREIGDYDFLGGDPEPEDRIFIKGLLTDFPDNDPTKSSEWFNEHDGGIVCWYNANTHEVHYGDKKDGFVLAIEIGFSARFNREDIEFETIRFFVNGDTDPFEDTSIITLKPHRHLKEFGFFLLPSKRMWDRTISFGSDLFNKVLRFQDAIPGETITALRDTLRDIEDKIEEQDPLKTIVERLNNELQGFLNSEDKTITFLPTSGDIAGVLHSLTPFIEGQQNTELPVSKHGSGLVSLQTLLLLLEFGRHRNEVGKNFFLLAEEPELHLNPGIHKRLVSRIRGLTQQSITTTHSPQISSYFKPEEILILHNDDGEVTANVLSSGGGALPNAIMRLFTLYRAEICENLMNNKVIIPEGITEYGWLRLIMNACSTAEGWDVYNLKDEHTKSFGILPTQSSAVVPTYSAFFKFIPNLYPFVDGDAAGDGYVADLLKLTQPPKIILQLGKNCMLEDLVAWILGTDAKKIQEIESLTEPLNGLALRDFLIKNKQNWIFHEAIVESITKDQAAFLRAQKFINSIYCIEALPTELTPFWAKRDDLSTDSTTIYTFKSPNA